MTKKMLPGDVTPLRKDHPTDVWMTDEMLHNRYAVTWKQFEKLVDAWLDAREENHEDNEDG